MSDAFGSPEDLPSDGLLMGRPVVWHIHGGRFVRFAESCGPFGLAVLQRALESAAAVVVLGRQWRDQLKSFAPGASPPRRS